MAYRVLSVNDLEQFYNFGKSSAFLPIGDIIELQKEITSGTGPGEAYWNAIYGAHAFYNMATEFNITGVLPKTTWARSGWRILKDWAYTSLTNKYDTYGIGETGTIDHIEADAKVMSVKTPPKIVANSFSVSEVMETMSEVDDNWGTIEQLREFGALEHSKAINMMLGERYDLSKDYSTRYLPLDLIITNDAELNSVGATSTNYTKANVYQIGRFAWDSTNSKVVVNSGYEWAVPYVHDAGGNPFSNEMILTTIMNARKRGANSNVIITGYDTYADIQNHYMQFVRYIGGWGETEIETGFGGVKAGKGVSGGLKVSALYGIPIIPSVNVDANANGKENIYVLDVSNENNEPRLGFGVARPTTYFQTSDPFINDAFKIRGLYRTMGETIAKFLYGQAKIYNLS